MPGFTLECGGATGNHLAIGHVAHDVSQIGLTLEIFALFPRIIARDVNHCHLWVGFGELKRVILHVIRVEDNQIGALVDQLTCQLGAGCARAISRIDFVDVNNFYTINVFFGIERTLMVSLAPAAIVEGADVKHTEDEGLRLFHLSLFFICRLFFFHLLHGLGRLGFRRLFRRFLGISCWRTGSHYQR